MSTGKSTKVFTREEEEHEEKGKLILGKDFVTKVHYLHNRVKSIEWSGILIYNQVQGTISDPENLVIEVIDFLPMDVGSAASTEYDFAAGDPDWQDIMEEAATKGYKIGHIHTHHSMSCFFSGVDMGELHENAGSHNYYLSLIVNFKEPSEWCAKIAIFGEEHHKGVRKTAGEYKITKSWKGEQGVEIWDEVEDLSNEETIDEKVEKLYLIDLNLEMTEDMDSLSNRITTLLKPKVTTTSSHTYPSHGGTNVGFPQGRKNVGKATEISPLNAKKGKSQVVLEYNEDSDEVSPNGRDAGQFSRQHVKPLLIKMLAQDEETGKSLDDVILDASLLEYNKKIILLDNIITAFSKYIEKHFQITADDIDEHCIAVTMVDILEPYGAVDFIGLFLWELNDEFILPPNFASISLTRKLTGIENYER